MEHFTAWSLNPALERLVAALGATAGCPECSAIAAAVEVRNNIRVDPWVTEKELEHIEDCGTVVEKFGREM